MSQACKICGEPSYVFPNNSPADVCKKHLHEKWLSRKKGDGQYRVKVICNGYNLSFNVNSLEAADECIKNTFFSVEKFDYMRHRWERIK